ncbi:AAA family ATPase [Galactobacter valiniphilus]|nr:AAA family ATPase [Galactobacter valiniphilus]
MSKIVSLTTTDFKRARRVDITPEGNVVILSGNNGEGKSSVLDSIAAALGGYNAKITPKPIRDGADRAEIVLETEELIVTRVFTESDSRLVVKSKDGATYSKGQAKLDEIVGKLALDPLAFTQLSDRDQLAQLLALVDLPFDLAELDARRAATFAERTEVNRRVKTGEGYVASLPQVPADTPDEEVSAAGLIAELQAANAGRAAYAQAEQDVTVAQRRVREAEHELERLRADALVNAERLASLPAPTADPAEIQERIAASDTINAAVRAKRERAAAEHQLAELRKQADIMTAALTAFDKEKAAGLAAAEFPVDGLGFDTQGVTFQGVPFKQASSAEQIRVSMAMAMALNPGLRVIRIADGSLLDPRSLALIKEQAEAHDFQIWIEMVGPREDGYVIEDGEIVAPADAASAA